MSDTIGKVLAPIRPMDVKEVLKLADDLIFAKTGQHLDDLQEAILRGTVQGRKYSKIAEESYCSEGHVRDIASELWKLLSEGLGEEVSKSNFRATLERWQISIVSSKFATDFVGINNVNFCAENLHRSDILYPPSPPKPTPYEEKSTPSLRIDLADAPDVASFYDRTSELTTLKQWILHDRTRLIALLGISGIGKTAIAIQLVQQIKDEFDCVIWQSLRSSPPLQTILTNLIQFLSNQQEMEGTRSRLMEYLRKYRCLVILDNVQAVFSSGQLAGHYKTGYEDYSSFFTLLGELSHNSCFVLTSWEPAREFSALQGQNAPVRSLHLNGLEPVAAREILRNQGLADENQWDELILHYQGNPLWLKIVATMIQDLFNGSVAEFLKYDTIFLGEDLKDILAQQYNRLSELEKEVMSFLAMESEAVSLSKLLAAVQIAPSELFNIMQSLRRRCLIQQNPTLFSLQPTIAQYVKTEYPRFKG